MPFDSTLPVDHAPVVSAELRAQFNGLFDLIQSVPVGPQGPAGPEGPMGPAMTSFVVDATNTLSPGSAAAVQATFDGTSLRFTFGIPRGEDGFQGSPGPTGPAFVSFVAEPVTTLSPGSNATFDLSFDGTTMHMIFGIPRGQDGVDGTDGVDGEVTFTQLFTAIAQSITGTAQNPSSVASIGLTISDPPTQAEVQQVADKLDELIAALKRV